MKQRKLMFKELVHPLRKSRIILIFSRRLRLKPSRLLSISLWMNFFSKILIQRSLTQLMTTNCKLSRSKIKEVSKLKPLSSTPAKCLRLSVSLNRSRISRRKRSTLRPFKITCLAQTISTQLQLLQEIPMGQETLLREEFIFCNLKSI